jgi:hypothetical protein
MRLRDTRHRRCGRRADHLVRRSEAELQRIEQRLRTHYPSTYTNTLNGITFVDGVDPAEHRVLITYPTPEQLPREVIDRRFRSRADLSGSRIHPAVRSR